MYHRDSLLYVFSVRNILVGKILFPTLYLQSGSSLWSFQEFLGKKGKMEKTLTVVSVDRVYM